MSARYVKAGLAGYGPDLDSEDEPYTDLPSLCSAIQYELSHAADFSEESASIAAESEDYETAWKSHALAVELNTLRMNLDYENRASAPLYRGDTQALEDTLNRIIDETFPLDVTVDGYTRLYVWEASE